jgi:hypothetical protein
LVDEIDPSANYSAALEEEQIDGYDTTIRRMKAVTNQTFAEELEKQIIGKGGHGTRHSYYIRAAKYGDTEPCLLPNG